MRGIGGGKGRRDEEARGVELDLVVDEVAVWEAGLEGPFLHRILGIEVCKMVGKKKGLLMR